VKTGFKIVAFLVSIFCNGLYAQSPEIYTAQTKLTIQSQDGAGKPFNIYTESAFMNLSLSTGDFLLKADLTVIRTGDNYLDSLIRSKPQQQLFFRGKMTENLYLFNQIVNDDKVYNLEGQLTINNLSIPCIAQFDPVNFGEKSEPRNYKMDFKVAIDPAKIPILGLENKLHNIVVFEVMDGQLNTQP
jgi:hypothetical protein